MSGKSIIDLRNSLERLNCRPKIVSGKLTSRCPGHNDKNPSFSATVSDDGKLLLKCFAGCATEEIVRSLGWTMKDLFPVSPVITKAFKEKNAQGLIDRHPLTATYGEPIIYWYHDRNSQQVAATVRWDKPDGGKECRPILKCENDWQCRAKEDYRPLYDLHKLFQADEDEVVFFVEGEKCVEALKQMNLLATTSQQGSNAPSKTDFNALRNKTVVVFPDNDKPGIQYAETVSGLAIDAECKDVRIVDLKKFFPELGKGGDVADLVHSRRKNPQLLLELREKFFELALSEEASQVRAKPKTSPGESKYPPAPQPVDLKKKATLNHMGVAKSVVAACSDGISWNRDTSRWMTFENGCWSSRRGDESMHFFIKEIAHKLCLDAHRLGDECCDGARSFTHSLCNQGTIDKVAKCCRSEPELQVGASQFDQHPYLLNLSNGTLDLKPNESGDFILRKHARKDFLTQKSPTKFDPSAKSELWEKTVQEIFFGDREIMEYMQKFAGVCLTGDVTDELIHIALGSGANGKTLFFEAIRNTLGNDYARPCPHNFFSNRRNEPSPLELHSIRGVRLSIASENDGEQGFQSDLIKKITGGEMLSTRGLYQDYSTCMPTSKFVMLVNELPKKRRCDGGLARRLRVVEFRRNFEVDGTRNNDLKRVLCQSGEHRSAILNWCLEGLRKWWDGRLLEPPCVVIEDTRRYVMDQNCIEKFLDDVCFKSSSERVRADKLFSALTSYIKNHELDINIPVTKNALTRELKSRGIESVKMNAGEDRNKRFYIGVGLSSNFNSGIDFSKDRRPESMQKGLSLNGDTVLEDF